MIRKAKTPVTTTKNILYAMHFNAKAKLKACGHFNNNVENNDNSNKEDHKNINDEEKEEDDDNRDEDRPQQQRQHFKCNIKINDILTAILELHCWLQSKLSKDLKKACQEVTVYLSLLYLSTLSTFLYFSFSFQDK